MVNRFLPLNPSLANQLSSIIAMRAANWADNWLVINESDVERNSHIEDRFEVQVNELGNDHVEQRTATTIPVKFESFDSQLKLSITEPEKAKLIELQTGLPNGLSAESLVNLTEIAERSLINLCEEIFGCPAEQTVDAVMNTQSNSIAGFQDKRVKLSYQGFSVEVVVPNKLLLSLLESESQTSDSNLIDRKSLFSEETVKFGVNVTGFKLKVGELATLQVGDVITANSNKKEQLEVLINDKPQIANCQLGKSNDKVCIQLD